MFDPQNEYGPLFITLRDSINNYVQNEVQQENGGGINQMDFSAIDPEIASPLLAKYRRGSIIRGLRTKIRDDEKYEIKQKTVFRNIIRLKRMFDAKRKNDKQSHNRCQNENRQSRHSMRDK